MNEKLFQDANRADQKNASELENQNKQEANSNNSLT